MTTISSKHFSAFRAGLPSMDGKTVVISGSGNVALHAAEKCMRLGGKVVALSDSKGSIYDPAGLTEEKLAWLKDLKEVRRGRISEYAEAHDGVTFRAGQDPWDLPCDLAFPCATQNELDGAEAQTLVANGCKAVAEGANMPCTPEAVECFQKAGVMFAPGKASNAGGVATSGLEMSQNSLRMSWTAEEVDGHLQRIMKDIHAQCVLYGQTGEGSVDYVRGANIAGFVKVAEAMIDQGVV